MEEVQMPEIVKATVELTEKYAKEPWLYGIRQENDDGGNHIEISVDAKSYPGSIIPTTYKGYGICVMLRHAPKQKAN
jgi:hypothetical protein